MKRAITRWKFDGHPDGPLESADGEYIEYADHVAEIARLRALVRRVANTDPVDYQRWDEITADAKKALDQ